MARFSELKLGRSFAENKYMFHRIHAHAGKRNDVEKLWRSFFAFPSQWRDHRSEKVNPESPDFKHKYTQESLWLDNQQNPTWVKSEMASIVPGTIEVSNESKRGLPLVRRKFVKEPSGLQPKRERLWCSFFSDPSQWWDNRPEKRNPNFPDFKHKHSQEALWLVDNRNPAWVASKIASIAPGTLQMSSFSWAQKLSKCNKAEQYKITMETFEEMQKEGRSGDRFTFVPVLNACAGSQDLEQGRRIHRLVTEAGCESDLYVGSCLVDMYAKCGSIDDAWSVFNKMPKRGVVVWSAMIQGLANCGQGSKALEIFSQMQLEGVEPNSFTFVALLKACISITALDEGRHVHALIKQYECEADEYVGSSLVDMYGKCGSIDDAWTVFKKMPTRGVVAWNAIILGHLKCGQGLNALEVLGHMERAGIMPNSVTYVGLLNACASSVALEVGRDVHEHIKQSGLESDAFVGSSLVDMYAKCGRLDDAWRVFNRIPMQTVAAWNAMVLCQVNSGQVPQALELFKQMQQQGVKPDSFTFVAVLNACAGVAALKLGRRIHAQIRQCGLESDIHVGSSLVDMYAKCGSIDNALTVFNTMPERGLVAWTAMIGGYAMYGLASEAVELFDQMCREGVKVNSVTFASLLSACSHGGLVKEGLQYFESMQSVYGVSPNTEHYTCMVDLLGRAGHLDDALKMVQTMPLKPDAGMWMSLLSACRTHCNLKMGELAAEHVLHLDPNNDGAYALLSNMYSVAGLWNRRKMIQRQRLDRGLLNQADAHGLKNNSLLHL